MESIEVMIGSKKSTVMGVMMLLGLAFVSMAVANVEQQGGSEGNQSLADAYRQQKQELEVIEAELSDVGAQLDSARSDYESALAKRDSIKSGVSSQLEQFFETAMGQQQITMLLTQYAEQLQELEAHKGLMQARESAFNDVEKRKVKQESKVAFLETQMSLLKEAEDRKLVAQLAGSLRQDVSFSRDLTFRCDFGSTLRQCLEQKNFNADIPSWLAEHYVQKMSDFEGVDVSTLAVNKDYFKFSAKHQFTSAQIDLNNIVSAKVDFTVKVEPHRALPCILLSVDKKLCDFVTHRLQVRSNRHGDEVLINGKSYGSTPLVVSLEGGKYDLVVKHQNSSRARQIELASDKKLFFRF
ncbi:hypothetical protein DMO17_18570 [Aquipseudomonas alcaligenes]|uniref:PEGA domain-containing protein n=1 Tax=Aquipseudomonas alcaligenes TaxID=43263 RepID=A0A2V4KSV7_AQUAC|nr:PEGA domain-containing protein [Pseudomonas alcaligenes]PYC20202.1 hypothetical protein DMO17_18570 [Pseudomonas alcaligenes]